MTDHKCDKEEVIETIGTNVSTLSGDIKVLCASNREVASTLKGMTDALTQHMIENKEHAVEIGHLVKNQDVLFDRLRRLEDIKIPEIEKTSAKNRARSEANEKEVLGTKLSLKEVKEAGETLHKTVDKLANWKNRIVGGLVVVGIIWSLVVAIGTRLLFKEG